VIDDHVQDALEILDKSEASYLLIIPFGRRTIFHSNLGAENAQKMVNAFAAGWLSDALIAHLHDAIEKGGEPS
jgi:hypothetical protein